MSLLGDRMEVKMKKLFCSYIIFLCIICTYSLNVFAQNTTEIFKLNNDVEEFVRSYFDAVDKSFSELHIVPELKIYFQDESNLEYISIDTSIQHRLLQISDLHYSNYSTDLTFENIEYENDILKVTVIKYTQMNFVCLNGEPSSTYERHILNIIDLGNSNFKIISDTHYDEIKDLLMVYIQDSNDTGILEPQYNIEFAKNRLLEESKKNVILQEEELKKLEDDTLSTDDILPFDENQNTTLSNKFRFKSYNREAARDYAFRYVLSPNSSYVNFEKMGGNCTNFTSQCLRAGGIPFDETGNYTWYYYDSNNRAPSWTLANGFRTYYKNNVGSSSIKGLRAYPSNFSNIRLGDLVQLVNNGKASHTMFVSSPIYDTWASSNPWKYKYDVGICQNSTSEPGRQKNIPLSTKPSNREYIHIEGSYN